MGSILELEPFGKLPLWAQAFIASRMVRRAARASHPHEKDASRLTIEAACDAIETCASSGDGTRAVSGALDAAHGLRDRASRDDRPVAEAIWWAIDACRAAEAAYDFPIDATVTHSAIQSMIVLGEDKRFATLQIAVLLAADIDLVRFACEQARIGKYDGLGRDVLGRVTPIHPLTIAPPAADREAGLER